MSSEYSVLGPKTSAPVVALVSDPSVYHLMMLKFKNVFRLNGLFYFCSTFNIESTSKVKLFNNEIIQRWKYFQLLIVRSPSNSNFNILRRPSNQACSMTIWRGVMSRITSVAIVAQVLIALVIHRHTSLDTFCSAFSMLGSFILYPCYKLDQIQ